MQNVVPITLAFCGQHKASDMGLVWSTWKGMVVKGRWNMLLTEGMAQISLPSCPQLKAHEWSSVPLLPLAF